MLTRMFAYLTLVSYLIVGTVAVRFCLPESVTLSFDSSYLSLVSDTSFKAATVEEISAPEMAFTEIKIPKEQIIVKKVKPMVVAKVAAPKVEVEVKEVVRTLAPNELPFHEPVTLTKVEMNNELTTNLVALYNDFSFNETVVADTQKVSDEVSTAQASAESAEVAEPEFFEYPVEKEVAVTQTPKTEKIETTVKSEPASDEVEVQDVADLMDTKSEEPVTGTALADTAEPEFFDYPAAKAAVTTQETAKAAVPTAQAPVAPVQVVTSGIAFDYSKANQAIANQTIPTVSKVTTHKSQKPKTTQESDTYKSEEEQQQGFVPDAKAPAAETQTKTKAKLKAPSAQTYPISLSVNALGSDLKKLNQIQGFEVRFQDDLSETLEDYGSGEVKIETEMSQPKMTRTVTLLKRGFIPTSTEIIMEEGTGSVSIPMIEEDTYNEVMLQHERRGSVGALLVELDDESELAKLDVKFGDVIKLDGDFKRTENEDFRYQLFVGVQAGNAMVSYHRGNGEVVSKIVHVHEHEVTYDANFYEDVVNEKVRLYEEDLLGKENSPLIISGEQVKVFATNNTAKKINNHTYKMNFGSSHLGGRRYLELTHQSEPVFVGIRDNNNVTVPSENFMRHILSNVEGAKLGNRCLVQVNLTKKAEKFEVASESVSQSLMTYTQVLDSDGKFYDSLSDKTQKIIIIGESQASQEVSPDAKVNIKIQYQDGSVQFLNSYCSPNTYLVEQL